MQDEDAKNPPLSPVHSDAMTLVSIESSIKNHLSQIAEVKEQLKTQNEMMKSFLENDPDFVEKSNIAKAATKEKSQVKQALLKQPAAASLDDKLKELKQQSRELQDGLSYYLGEYQRMTGFNEFEDEEGNVKQIVYVAKLVKKA